MTGTEWDAPNQQVVRADQSPPWDEGTGGEPTDESGGIVPPGTPPPDPIIETEAAEPPPELDEMTKEQLLEHAQNLGVSPANHAMTKDELRAGIDAKLAEAG
jgi:hypothetical protein